LVAGKRDDRRKKKRKRVSLSLRSMKKDCFPRNRELTNSCERSSFAGAASERARGYPRLIIPKKKGRIDINTKWSGGVPTRQRKNEY